MLVSGDPSNAMRSVGGKGPVADGQWPDGCVAVANLPTRIAYSVGDSPDTDFVYRGDTEDFQKALAAFAAIRAPVLELHVHDGPHPVAWVGNGEKGHVDWMFTVNNVEEWHRMFNDPNGYASRHQPVPPPRLDVYAGAPLMGVEWARVTVPEGIRVTDERAPAKQAKPAGPPKVHGVIYDMANGKTIAGAKVMAKKSGDKEWQTVATTLTDATGRYQIDNPPEGSYLVVAEVKGYAARVLGGQWSLPNASMQLDGELSAEVSVKGTVTDDQDKPLSGVLVRVENALGIDGRVYESLEQRAAKTDAAGRFTMPGAPTGFARFTCQGAGYAMLNSQTLWRIESWKVITGDALKKTGEVPVSLHMDVPGTIRCKVLSKDGAPLKDDWDVTIADAEGGYSSGRFSGRYQRTAHVQADGNVEFTEVPMGHYFVAVGYQIDTAREVRNLIVRPGKTAETTLSIMPRPVPPPPPRQDNPKPVTPPKPPPDDKF
jgi:protocatechuate 3,4-dioxygenase beta subunit